MLAVFGWMTKIYYIELLRVSEGMLSRWFRLHLQSLASTIPYWARVVRYGPFSLCVIHKEGLCPSNGDIYKLMMNPSDDRPLRKLLSVRIRALITPRGH
jgi:hypothetical protein